MRILRNAQFRGIITHMLNIRVLNKLALVTVVAVAATLFWEDGLSVEAQAAPTQYAWTFETVAHAGPIEGTCTPDTRVTGLGFGTGGAPVVGWRDTSGCIPADLPENFPNRWATKEDSRWRTYEIGENVHGAGRGSTFQRGTPALSVAEDGTPYMLYPDVGPGICQGNSCLYMWQSDLSTLPNGGGGNIEFLGHHQQVSTPLVNLGAGSPPNRLTTINYGNDSGPLKLNGLEIDAGSIYDRAYANGPGGGGHHIVWFDGNNIQGRNIWYSNGTPNAAISILETSTVNGLAIAADNTGIHAVLAVGALLHSKSANGVTFDETVIDASSGTKLPSAAVGPDGSLHVVYFRGNNNLYHAWLKDGQWSSYSLISSPSNDFASRSPKATRLVFDREGRPNALIYHGDLRQITIATGTPAPATRLTISTTGTGDGTVSGDPGDISCTDECVANFPTDSYVTMTAVPDLGSTFVGWVGPCAGDGACVLRMTSAISVGAVFDQTPPVTNPINVDSFLQSPGAAGDCTLGEAIQAANTNTAVDACPAGSGADTIVLPAGTYTLSVIDNGENGLPLVSSDITIQGDKSASTTIERSPAAPNFRFFRVNGALTLNDLTIRGGRGSSGGAIAYGDLEINNSIFEDNVAASTGGVIYSNGLIDVTIRGSTFRNNSASGSGVITTVGSLRIENSTFEDNHATGSSAGAVSFSFSVVS